MCERSVLSTDTGGMSQASIQLIVAARDGDLATVRRVLAEGRVDVNATDEYGRSPLYRASYDGHLQVVKTLIEAGANTNKANQDGRSPLLTASINGHLDVVKTLIQAGSNVNQGDKMNGTPLFVASVKGHHDVVQCLLGAGADVNIITSDDGRTPLLTASINGHLNVVKSLIQAGSNVNQGDKINANPLFVASEKNHHDIVKSLLAAGADVNITTSDICWSALLAASFNGNLDIVKTLIQTGSNVNQSDKDCRSPLYSASFNGHLAVVKTLIEAGAFVDQVSKNGWSPLMASTYKGHLDIVKTLIEAGSNVHQTNKDGKTALKIAVEKGQNDIIEVLKISQTKVASPKPKVVQRAKERTEQQPFDTKLQINISQQVRPQLQAQQADERVKSAEERATRAEQELLDTKQTNDALKHQVKQLVQQADEKVSAEERATKAEQELLEAKQKSEAFKQQVKQLVQQVDGRAKIAEEKARDAEERAIRAEKELKILRQQSEAQLRCQESQGILQSSGHMKPSWKIEPDEIQVIKGKLVGAGAWGEVREAMFRGAKVAAKFIHKEIISPHISNLFIREMNIAACVRHPNLLLFIGAVLDENNHIIITELMPTNLRNCIPFLTRDHVISIGRDVARGLNYLHKMRPDPIIHRDVSSANVLLEPIRSDSWKAKVSDYGSANFLSKVSTIGPGNPSYAAPELSNPKLQSPKMDVYSYGILLYEMATGQFPDNSLLALILDTLQWQEMSVLINRCICQRADDRPTMQDILIELHAKSD